MLSSYDRIIKRRVRLGYMGVFFWLGDFMRICCTCVDAMMHTHHMSLDVYSIRIVGLIPDGGVVVLSATEHNNTILT